MRHSKRQTRAIQLGMAALAAGAMAMMSGCAALNMTESGAASDPVVQGAALHGIVHGGNNAVVGAVIQLYQVGATGYGKGAVPLLNETVTTGANGSFSFTTSNWSCNSGADIYITATGGNPGLGSTTNGGSSATPNNPYAAFVAALGSCTNINSNTDIYLNEVTTVAAVWALQQFISIVPGTSLYAQPGVNPGVSPGTTSSTPAVAPSFSIGSSPGNVQGLQNAFEVAAVLANYATGTTPGSLPAPVSPVTTATRTLAVDTWQINTIADILAACINTDTTTGNADYSATCSNLAASVTPSTTNLPVDTLQIAYEMTQNPSYNVANTFTYVPSVGAPFVPADAVVSDWTVSYTVSYPYPNAPGSKVDTILNKTEGIAVDSYGNIWTANTGGGNTTEFVTELDGAGNYVATYTSYLVGTTSTSFGLANSNYTQPLTIDPSGNVWTEDNGNQNLVRIAAAPGYAQASTGTNYGIFTGTTSETGTSSMASDGNGNIYMGLTATTYSATFPATNNLGLLELVPSISGTTGLTQGSGSGVQKVAANSIKGIAITNDHGSSSYGGLVYLATAATACSSSDTASLNTYFSQAQTIDTTTTTLGAPTPIGQVVNSLGYKACSTASTPATPTSATQTYAGNTYTIPAMDAPYGLAVDSADNIWVANGQGSAVASGYPEYWITELTPTYSVSSAGVLSASYAANLYTAPFLTGTSGGATAYFTIGTPNGLAVDGKSNIWFPSNSGAGTFAAVSQAGIFLNPTGVTNTTVTNGTTTDTWTCSGFCGGLVYAGYSTRRGVGSGFAGIAIDLAGNVWGGQANSTSIALTTIVGVAAPPVLPTSLAIKNGTLGTRP